jgi:hypothetical protein
MGLFQFEQFAQALARGPALCDPGGPGGIFYLVTVLAVGVVMQLISRAICGGGCRYHDGAQPAAADNDRRATLPMRSARRRRADVGGL